MIVEIIEIVLFYYCNIFIAFIVWYVWLSIHNSAMLLGKLIHW